MSTAIKEPDSNTDDETLAATVKVMAVEHGRRLADIEARLAKLDQSVGAPASASPRAFPFVHKGRRYRVVVRPGDDGEVADVNVERYCGTDAMGSETWTTEYMDVDDGTNWPALVARALFSEVK